MYSDPKFIGATYKVTTVLAILGFGFGLAALIGVIWLALMVLP